MNSVDNAWSARKPSAFEGSGGPAPIDALKESAQDALHRHGENGGLGKLNPLGNRIVPPQHSGQALGKGHDGARFVSQAPVLQLRRQLACVDEQSLNAVEAPVENAPESGTGTGCFQCRNGLARRRKPILRQIDAVEIAVVVLAVLQMINLL